MAYRKWPVCISKVYGGEEDSAAILGLWRAWQGAGRGAGQWSRKLLALTLLAEKGTENANRPDLELR